MTPSPNKRHRLVTLIAYLKRMSIRRKITFAILLAYVLTLPSAAMSLVYFSRILQEINTIIEQDVTIGRYATDMSVIMLDIRRNERNYRLIGSDAERETIQSLINHIRTLLAEADDIAPDSEKMVIHTMAEQLRNYENNLNLLIDYFKEHPPENYIEQLRSQLSKGIEDFQERYQDIQKKLETAKPAERDSLIALVSGSLDAISYDQLIGVASDDENDNQTVYIQENLNQSLQLFLDTAQTLANQSWSNMLEHRSSSLHIEARAKRNIITVMILTGLICLYVVMSLPRKIMRPITRLNILLKKTGEGDFRSFAKVYTDDEIGDLAHNYNLVLERINRYDELKTKKIASQKRMIDRLLENLPMPVCMLSSGLVLLYYNAPFAEFFRGVIPPKPPDTGVNLDKNDELQQLTNKLQRILEMPSNEFLLELADSQGNQKRFKGRLIRNTLMKMESIILVGTDILSSGRQE